MTERNKFRIIFIGQSMFIDKMLSFADSFIDLCCEYSKTIFRETWLLSGQAINVFFMILLHIVCFIVTTIIFLVV